MFDVSFPELVLVAVIGLLVLGPQRLPKVAAEIGKWVSRARRTATQLRRQLEREIELSDIEPPPPRPPPRPAAPPPSAAREGDVPDGPGTHADRPDAAVTTPSADTGGSDQPTPDEPASKSPSTSPAQSPEAQPADRPPP